MAGMKTETHALLIERNSNFTSNDVYKEILRLVRREHQTGAKIIALLAEVAEQEIFVQLGYPSLFRFCVDRLGLSEGCAWMRVQVSRACCRFPSILDALADQRLSLSSAAKLAPHLTTENCDQLVADCSGKTKREVERYLVKFAPKPVVTPGVRRGSGRRRGSIEPCQPGLQNVRFAADDDFAGKLERAGEVSGIGTHADDIAEVLERSLDAYLDKHDPVRRQARRDKQAEAKKEQPPKKTETPTVAKRTPSRAVADQVIIGAGCRCEYTGVDGTRCSQRSFLEIDHRTPFAMGGPTKPNNLRVLCEAHNQFAARQLFGTDFMKAKIEAAQNDRSRSTRPGEYSPSLPPIPSPEQSTNPSLRTHVQSP
jgi:hypothetical protein